MTRTLFLSCLAALGLGLAAACFWLAKKGAEWSLREEEEAAERDGT